MTYTRYDLVDLRMHHRFAARDRYDRRPELGELVDPLEHRLDRHRIGGLVVLIAVGAREIASPHRHDVHEYGMLGRCERPDSVPDAACESTETACFRH